MTSIKEILKGTKITATRNSFTGFISSAPSFSHMYSTLTFKSSALTTSANYSVSEAEIGNSTAKSIFLPSSNSTFNYKNTIRVYEVNSSELTYSFLIIMAIVSILLFLIYLGKFIKK